MAVAVSAGYLVTTTHCTMAVAVSAGYLVTTTHCTMAVAVSAGYLVVITYAVTQLRFKVPGRARDRVVVKKSSDFRGWHYIYY